MIYLMNLSLLIFYYFCLFSYSFYFFDSFHVQSNHVQSFSKKVYSRGSVITLAIVKKFSKFQKKKSIFLNSILEYFEQETIYSLCTKIFHFNFVC
jgi:uncharacterized FlgJ-related protein